MNAFASEQAHLVHCLRALLLGIGGIAQQLPEDGTRDGILRLLDMADEQASSMIDGLDEFNRAGGSALLTAGQP